MHIQSVEKKDCAFSPDNGRYYATLLLSADTRRMSLRAAADYHAGMHRNDVVRVLIEDATRQLRRMPEHRNAKREIKISDAALPRASQTLLAA